MWPCWTIRLVHCEYHQSVHFSCVSLIDCFFLAQVDICVHSMKDVPTWLPEGTVLPCNLVREETNDVFISKKFRRLSDLADGSVIGSASLRRQAQLLAINPTLKVVNFRGNVQTRLKKIENGEHLILFTFSSLTPLMFI